MALLKWVVRWYSLLFRKPFNVMISYIICSEFGGRKQLK